MYLIEPLRAAIKRVLVEKHTTSRLEAACDDLGLPPGTTRPGMSKGEYAAARLDGVEHDQILEAAEALLKHHPDQLLAELVAKAREGGQKRISQVTRRNILDELALLGEISGKLGLTEFLSRIWPLDQMRSTDPRFSTAAGDICQHMVMNNDWDYSYLFSYLGLDGCSDDRFSRFVEQLVHPLARQDDDQAQCVAMLNGHLRNDGFELRAVGNISGHPTYAVSSSAGRGVQGPAKNLIFASNGPKPEIILSDAINNDIRIVRNEEHVLVFDRPIPRSGLSWRALVEWWADRASGNADDIETERALFSRLRESLASDPERHLFKTYFTLYKEALGDALPALVPQVYLHFDPMTLRELGGQKRLPVQRMDFLILFSDYERVVLELDGKQHYADGDAASPRRYAEMVREDRELRLRGYEVYRFGGGEFTDEACDSALKLFFDRLLRKHGKIAPRV